MAHPAFLGSVIDTTQLVLSLLGKEAFTVEGTSDAVSVFQTKWPNHISLSDGIMLGRLRSNTLSSETIADAPAKSQSNFQEIVDGNIWDALRAAAPANSRDRLDATRRKHAGAWISVFPNQALGLWMPSREFSVAVRCWIGSTTQAENRSLLKPGLVMYGRHHSIQECLMGLCKSAGVSAQKEILIDTSNQRPADVSLPHWRHGVSYAVDVTVSHPSQATTPSSDGADSPISASERAACAKCQAKDNKYRSQCEARGIEFLAAVVCCFGGWLEPGEDLVNDLATRSAARSGQSLPMIKSQFWQRLSMALWRGNAGQLLHYT